MFNWFKKVQIYIKSDSSALPAKKWYYLTKISFQGTKTRCS